MIQNGETENAFITDEYVNVLAKKNLAALARRIEERQSYLRLFWRRYPTFAHILRFSWRS